MPAPIKALVSAPIGNRSQISAAEPDAKQAARTSLIVTWPPRARAGSRPSRLLVPLWSASASAHQRDAGPRLERGIGVDLDGHAFEFGHGPALGPDHQALDGNPRRVQGDAALAGLELDPGALDRDLTGSGHRQAGGTAGDPHRIRGRGPGGLDEGHASSA